LGGQTYNVKVVHQGSGFALYIPTQLSQPWGELLTLHSMYDLSHCHSHQ
jgi:hypothetical protein